MRKRGSISILFIFAIILNLQAWNNLRIIDPLNPWWDLPSKISAADITVHPKGAFMEVGMYLVFSTDVAEVDTSIQLEAIYNFDLPENAIVTDSWLWIDDVPEKALILDRWTASAIYESIVDRRQDPSILTKTGQTTYELKVYPLKSNMPRKVKITYLIPTSWSANEVSVPLPVNQLRVGWERPEHFSVFTEANSSWNNPRLRSDSIISFQSVAEPEYPGNNIATLNMDHTNLHLVFDSPMQEGLYLNNFQVDNTGYYQLAILPSAILQTDKPNKICFLVDYRGSKGSIKEHLKFNIKNNMADVDSFNIMIAGIEIYKASEVWLPADDATVDEIFESIDDLENSYSVLPVLISQGMKFTEDDGNLLIISDNSDMRSNDAANQLIEDLGVYKPWPVIHVLDLNYYDNGIWMGNRAYYGNEYLYGLLCRQSNGNYLSLRNEQSIPRNMEELMQSSGGFISSFDLYTTLTEGYCFSRYFVNSQSNISYLNRPIVQIGRYFGEFPFEMTLSGVYDNQPFSEDLSVSKENSYVSDSINRQIWAGLYIRSLEQYTSSNEIIGEIITESIDNRILTSYTAFLTLEPGMEPEIQEGDDEFVDGGGWIGEVEEKFTSIINVSLSAYPNPFSSEIKIELEIPLDQKDDGGSLKVYNLSGQLVRSIELDDNDSGDLLVISWDGRDDSGIELKDGVYILKYSSIHATKNIRIIKIS